MAKSNVAGAVSNAQDRVLDPDNEFSQEELEALGFADSADSNTVEEPDGEESEQPEPEDGATEGAAEGDAATDSDEPAATDEPKYLNALDYVLRHEGFKGDEVEIEGARKKISELTAEEQMDLLVEAYERKSVALTELSLISM